MRTRFVVLLLAGLAAVLCGCAGRATRRIDRLLADLQSESRRRSAERTLAEHGRAIIKPLSNIVTGEDIEKTVKDYDIKTDPEKLRVPAAKALGLMAAKASLARSEAELAAKPLLTVLLESKDRDLRLAAAEALGHFTQLTTPINDLIIVLREDEAKLAEVAAQSIVGNALHAIYRLILVEEPPAAAVEKEWDRLVERLGSMDDEIRLDTVREMAASRDPRAADLLLDRVAQDKSGDVRYAALRYCVQVASDSPEGAFAPKLYLQLVTSFGKDSDSRVVLVAAQVLRDREPRLIGTVPERVERTTQLCVQGFLATVREREYGLAARVRAIKALALVAAQVLRDQEPRPVGTFLERVKRTTELCVQRLLAAAQNREYDAAARADAINALGRLAPSSEASLPAVGPGTPGLWSALPPAALESLTDQRDTLLAELVDRGKGEAARIRRAAASVLAASDTGTALRALRGSMEDRDSIVKLIAAQALGGHGEPEDIKDAVGYLVELLSHKEAKIRTPAADALGTLGAKALPVLVDQLTQSLANAQELAQWEVPLQGLQRKKDPTSDERAEASRLEKAIRDWGSKHPGRDERHIAWGIVTGLGSIAAAAGSEAAPALDVVARAAQCHYPSVRRAAMDALGHFPGEKAIATLIEGLTDPDDTVRWYAATALERLGAAAAPALVRALDSPDTLGLAAKSLARVGNADALKPLLAQVVKAEGAARADLIWAIGETLTRYPSAPDAAAARDVLRQASQQADDPDAARLARYALARVEAGPPE